MYLLRSAVAAALLAATGPALAEDWKLAGLSIGDANRAATYVDADSVREKRGKIRFRSEQYLESGRSGFNRVAALSEVDCSSMTVTVLREGYYANSALVAFGRAPREENYYSANTSYHWVLRRVCEGEYLSASVDDHRNDSARLFTLDWSPVPGRLSVYVPTVVQGMPSGTQVAAMGSGGATTTAAPRR